MAEQPIGQLLDALNVTIDLDEGQQLTQALVIAKAVDFNDEDMSRARLVIAQSDGMDWISQLGLIAATNQVMSNSDVISDDDDDDD